MSTSEEKRLSRLYEECLNSLRFSECVANAKIAEQWPHADWVVQEILAEEEALSEGELNWTYRGIERQRRADPMTQVNQPHV